MMKSKIDSCKLDIIHLKERREFLGLSKNEMAHRLNISQPAYVRYESGQRQPSMPVIKEIANILNTSIDYITGKIDNPKPDFYEINFKDNPQIFSLIETYYHLDKKDAERFICYVENFK